MTAAVTVAPQGRGLAVGGVLSIVGAVLTIVGTALPWEQINATLAAANQARSALGVEYDDGKIFIFLAILGILASGCFLAGRRLPAGLVGPVGRLLGNGAGLSVLIGGYVVCFGILNWRDIAARVDIANAAVGGIASVGIGLYLDLAAGAIILVGAAIGLLARRD
jgi:hypothetical protein